MASILELEKVRNRILEYPENFDYEHIMCRRKGLLYALDVAKFENMLKHNSNTCGCVSGFTVCDLPKEDRWTNTIDQAREILDLTYSEKQFLFCGREPFIAEQDPDRYLVNYDYPAGFCIEACSQEEGRTEALKRIDFILDHYRNLSNAVAT